MIDKHFFEQIFRKVEPECFLYEFFNSEDPLYNIIFPTIEKTRRKSCYITLKIQSGVPGGCYRAN